MSSLFAFRIKLFFILLDCFMQLLQIQRLAKYNQKFVRVALKKMNAHHFYDDKGTSSVPMNIHNVLPYMKKYVELNLVYCQLFDGISLLVSTEKKPLNTSPAEHWLFLLTLMGNTYPGPNLGYVYTQNTNAKVRWIYIVCHFIVYHVQ